MTIEFTSHGAVIVFFIFGFLCGWVVHVLMEWSLDMRKYAKHQLVYMGKNKWKTKEKEVKK